jgi:aryl carrier-like protein
MKATIPTIQSLRGLTLIAHFEDPGVSIAFKDILANPTNKKLLLKYEASLPSWTVVMAQYTGYYRPW